MRQGMVRFSQLSRHRQFKAVGECAISLFIFYNLAVLLLTWAEPLLPQTGKSAAIGNTLAVADRPPAVSYETKRVILYVWRYPTTQRSPLPSKRFATRAVPPAEVGFGTVQYNFDRVSH